VYSDLATFASAYRDLDAALARVAWGVTHPGGWNPVDSPSRVSDNVLIMEKDVRLTLRLSRAMLTKLEGIAKKQGRTVADVVRRAIARVK